MDDHPVVLEGTKTLFTDVKEIEIETANTYQEIIPKIKERFYDLYLLDINLPGNNGVEIAEEIRKLDPESRIILYTGYDIKDYYHLLLNYNIDGIVHKTASKEQLLRVIFSALNDEITVPNDFISFMKRYMDQNNESSVGNINEKELQILKFISQGYTNKAIACELEVTQRTIEKYISKIFTKLDADSRVEAVMKAQELKIL